MSALAWVSTWMAIGVAWAEPPAAPPNPLAGLTDAQVCASDELLLLRYPFADLQGGACQKVCCAVDPEHRCCVLDWPFSDVPSCDAYAELRNGIFARYGYPFKDPKWQARFGREAWYSRREDFDAAWLSATAKANVDVVKRKETAREGCQ